MIGAEIILQVRLEIGTRREGTLWIAFCPSLDVLSQGKTRAQAISSLREAIDLWFESCVRRGVLDRALVEAGFKRGRDAQSGPSPSSLVTVRKREPHSRRQNGNQANHPAPRFINVSVPAYSLAHPVETGAAG